MKSYRGDEAVDHNVGSASDMLESYGDFDIPHIAHLMLKRLLKAASTPQTMAELSRSVGVPPATIVQWADTPPSTIPKNAQKGLLKTYRLFQQTGSVQPVIRQKESSRHQDVDETEELAAEQVISMEPAIQAHGGVPGEVEKSGVDNRDEDMSIPILPSGLSKQIVKLYKGWRSNKPTNIPTTDTNAAADDQDPIKYNLNNVTSSQIEALGGINDTDIARQMILEMLEVTSQQKLSEFLGISTMSVARWKERAPKKLQKDMGTKILTGYRRWNGGEGLPVATPSKNGVTKTRQTTSPSEAEGAGKPAPDVWAGTRAELEQEIKELKDRLALREQQYYSSLHGLTRHEILVRYLSDIPARLSEEQMQVLFESQHSCATLLNRYEAALTSIGQGGIAERATAYYSIGELHQPLIYSLKEYLRENNLL